MGPGTWATWNWDQGPGPGPSLGLGLGPWPAWAREPGRAWDQVGPRAQAGPGLLKKHDNAMKMKHLDAKARQYNENDTCSSKTLIFLLFFACVFEDVSVSLCVWTPIVKH